MKWFGRRSDGEPVCWTSVHADRDREEQQKPLWQGFRAWLHWNGWEGKVNCPVTFEFEWKWLSHYLGAGLALGGEYDLSLSLGIRLFALYLRVENLCPYRWLPRDQARQIELQWHHGGLWWDCWSREFEWNSRDPWWMDGHFDPMDFLFGRTEYLTRVTGTHPVRIPMPEGCYPATVTMEECCWKRPRWPFRLSPGTYAEIEPAKPILHRGKGENSYDCGMDGLCALHCRADTVEEAVGKTVASALTSRRKYGWDAEDDEAARVALLGADQPGLHLGGRDRDPGDGGKPAGGDQKDPCGAAQTAKKGGGT